MGALVGWRGLLPKSWLNHIPTLSRGFLLLMLFFLGAKLGSSVEVSSHLATLGLKALTMSLATMIGSVLFTAVSTSLLRYRFSESAPDTSPNMPLES